MHKIKVNGAYDFELVSSKDKFLLKDQEIDVDIKELSNGHLHVIYQHRSYNIEVVSSNSTNKTAVIKINGKLYHTAIEDHLDRLLKEMGLEHAAAPSIAHLKAPMPGLVLDIQVTEGQELKKGDPIVILEAMKMENILKSATDGVIQKIHVIKGDKVEKNQILVTFA